MKTWEAAEGHAAWLDVHGGQSNDHQLSLRLLSQLKGQDLLTGTAGEMCY